MEKDNAFEYYFLTDCYNEGITEDKIYRIVIEKIISNLKPPYNNYINSFHQHILNEYSIDIPPTMIKSLLKEVSKCYPNIILKKDYIKIDQVPINLMNKISKLQKEADNDSRIIFRGFNQYLDNTNCDAIQFQEFNTLLKTYHQRLIGDAINHSTKIELVFFEWCNRVFTARIESDFSAPLSKLIYSWIVYYYFQSIKRKNKKLKNFLLLLDTNIIIYYLGVNGDERKKYVKYLLEKAATNNCTIMILDRTVKEIVRLFKHSSDPEIKVFKNANKDIVNQISSNPYDYFRALFLGLKLNFELRTYSQKFTVEEFNEIECGLNTYKLNHRFKPPSETSVKHDVRLLDTIGINKKINNIYEHSELLITTDDHLSKYAEKYTKDKFDSTSTLLLTLEKASFIFWIESSKAGIDSFAGNTWLYVSESINYFHENKINTLYKKFRKRVTDTLTYPESWRSPYLLFEKEIEKNSNEEEFDLDAVIDRINIVDENEMYRIKQESQRKDQKIIKLQKEYNSLQKENEIIKERPIIINNNVEKPPKNYSMGELFMMLFKRIIKFFISD